MIQPRASRIVGDVSGLPQAATGPRNVTWWGNIFFMLIEGTAFVLAGGCCLYLAAHSAAWPQQGFRPPDLLWGSLFTVGMLLSEIPTLWLLGKAKAKQDKPVRWLALAMFASGLVLLALRWAEFQHLNVSWSDNAYGSVVWMLMILHTTHIFTELGEDGVQTLWLFTHEIGENQFGDVADNCEYWTFVVLAWLPIYCLIYWLPRLT